MTASVGTTRKMNVINKWKIDLTTGGARIATRGFDQSLNPPGYNPSFVATQQVCGKYGLTFLTINIKFFKKHYVPRDPAKLLLV